MKLNVSWKLYAGFGIALLIVGIISLVAFRGTQSLVKNQSDVNQTHDVLEELEHIVASLKDAETGQRGFLITGEDRFLEPYDAGIGVLDEHIASVQSLTSDNPAQQARIEEMKPFVAEKLDELAETIQLRRVEGFEAAQTVVLTDAGKNSADAIRRIIDEMTVEERDLLVVRAASTESSAGTVKTVILGGLVVAIVVVGVIAIFLSRSIAGGIGQVSKGLKAIAVGDLGEKVEITSKDELGAMSEDYAAMQTYLSEMADVAKQFADGDLSTEVQAKSDKDVLGVAYVEMQAYMKEMAEAAGQIADGDLTINVTPKSDKDLLGNAFASMITNLRDVIGEMSNISVSLGEAKAQLADAATQSSESSQEVAKSTSQVADGTSKQASSAQSASESVEQLSKAIGEISSGTQKQTEAIEQASNLVKQVSGAAEQMAENAESTATGAREAMETAKDGAQKVQQTIDAIGKIKETVDSSADEMNQLGERSSEIGNIISVIDDIAAQTNLLALNAAIEAARAGEQGRGFAVVADEVRNLAERVVSATKEIAGLIGGVQEGVASSVKSMEAGSAEMESGNQLAAEAGTALEEILAAVRQMEEQISKIAKDSGELKATGSEMVTTIDSVREVAEQNMASTEEMEATSGEVGTAIASVASVAQENSAAVQQVSAAAEETSAQAAQVSAATVSLGEMAENLKARVGQFTLNGNGSSKSTTNGKAKGGSASSETEREKVALGAGQDDVTSSPPPPPPVGESN